MITWDKNLNNYLLKEPQQSLVTRTSTITCYKKTSTIFVTRTSTITRYKKLQEPKLSLASRIWTILGYNTVYWTISVKKISMSPDITWTISRLYWSSDHKWINLGRILYLDPNVTKNTTVLRKKFIGPNFEAIKNC